MMSIRMPLSPVHSRRCQQAIQAMATVVQQTNVNEITVFTCQDIDAQGEEALVYTAVVENASHLHREDSQDLAVAIFSACVGFMEDIEHAG